MTNETDHDDQELVQFVRGWFERLRQQAPLSDPRRTGQCLSIPEAVGVARQAELLPAERSEHVTSCTFCQSALRAARRALAGDEATISRPHDAWSAALQECLRQWPAQQPQAAASPAQFDDHGVLHVNWSGLPKNGACRLSLRWGNTLLPLGEGVVEKGVLAFSASLSHLGICNQPISPHLLQVEWLEPDEPETTGSHPDASVEISNHSKEVQP